MFAGCHCGHERDVDQPRHVRPLLHLPGVRRPHGHGRQVGARHGPQGIRLGTILQSAAQT